MQAEALAEPVEGDSHCVEHRSAALCREKRRGCPPLAFLPTAWATAAKAVAKPLRTTHLLLQKSGSANSTPMHRECSSAPVLGMKAQANAYSSLLFSSCGLLATLVAASVFGGAVAATKMGTVCGGLFGASAFFNALHVITGLEAAINIRNQAGVVEGARARQPALGAHGAVLTRTMDVPYLASTVAFALLVAAMTGGIIHRVSVTTRCGRAAGERTMRCLMPLPSSAAHCGLCSVLFSFVTLYYVMGASDAIHGGDSGVRVNPSKAPSRRKR